MPTKINLVGKSEVAESNAGQRNVAHISRPTQLAPLLRKLMTENRKSVQDRFILVRAPWIEEEREGAEDTAHPLI